MGRLANRRILVTEAQAYMGPAITELFRNEGADVVADERDVRAPGAAAAAVADAAPFDALVANLSEPPRLAATHEIEDGDWHRLFDALVHPLMRLVRAALPAMIEGHRGKIVAVTSAAPLRGIPRAAAYCAARGAQNAFVRAVGLEVARHNVQVNAIAQNYVENNVYYPPSMLADTVLLDRMKKAVPAARLAGASESAELALFLCSDRCNFMVGQIVPFAGGWVTTTG